MWKKKQKHGYKKNMQRQKKKKKIFNFKKKRCGKKFKEKDVKM